MDAFIYDHVRTPRGRGRPDGALHEIPAVELLTQTLRAIRDRNDLDTALLDDVVAGSAQPVAEQGGNVARAAVVNAGYAETVAGQQVNRFCASGLEAVNTVAAQIMSGMCEAGIGCGVESMSRVPFGFDSGAWVADPHVAFRHRYAPQGIGADLIATLDGFSREDVDAYALESQRRADRARKDGRFARSITPVSDVMGATILVNDEHCRPDATMESLAALKPAFAGLAAQGFGAVVQARYPEVEELVHVHTAGNSSGVVDGAGAVLLGSETFGARAGLKRRARIRAFAAIGSEPTIMLTAPAAVSEKALAKAGMTKADIDLWELNEAFASVVLRFMRRMDVDHARINVNGGAIALGHPLGATGAMILGTVLDELERQDLNTALVVLCAGNGLGGATIIERV
jgi:acetyl-CoA C-acetyltransferase